MTRQTNVVMGTSLTTSWSDLPSGLLYQLTMPGGVAQRYTFDSVGRRSAIEVQPKLPQAPGMVSW